MASLLESKCENWIDETGDSIVIVSSPCGGKFYIDAVSRKLNKKYNPFVSRGGIKLGSAGLEGFAVDIARLFPIMQSFGGISEESLNAYSKVYQNLGYPQRLVSSNCLREKMIMGTKVLFATEHFIQLFS